MSEGMNEGVCRRCLVRAGARAADVPIARLVTRYRLI